MLRHLTAVTSITIALTSTAAWAAGDQRNCAVDLDSSGVVDGSDLGMLLATWGVCPDCDGDFDGNGVIDGADLGELLAHWGPLPVFDFGPTYPDDEAWQIALELAGPGGPIIADPDQYERIDRDLDLIRAEVPALANQGHTPAWSPLSLIVGVLVGQPLDDFHCLNEYYQLDALYELFEFEGVQMYVLAFPHKLNPEALATVYATLPEVQFAEPDSLIGGQNDWMPMPGPDGTWTWVIDDGFHDCFDGCDCHTTYTITVTKDGTVSVNNVEQFGAPWCEFAK